MLKTKLYKCIGSLMAVLLVYTEVLAQSATQFEVGAAGGSNSIDTYIIDYTIGEPVTTTVNNTKTIFTQGFQQPAYTLSVLPLTLVSFTGIKQNAGNLLSWETTNEVNVKRFFLERSSTNDAAFMAITTMPPLGNLLLNKYTYFDETAKAGTFFYRLKMEDMSGSITYSSVISFTNLMSDLMPIKIYPTVATTHLNVVSYSPANTVTTYTIINMAGILQKRETHMASLAVAQVLDLSNLVSGTYTLTVVNPDNKWAGKFIKQ